MAQARMAPVKNCNLIMFGATGVGKSRTGNMILGRKVFDVSSSSRSVTKKFKFESSTVNGRTVTICDTPGVHDTDLDEEQGFQLVEDNFDKAFRLNKEGVKAFMYVLKYGTRLTKAEKDTLKIFETMFGEKSLEKFGILVLTHGDNFEGDQEDEGLNQTILEWCLADEGMNPLVKRFGCRVVIVNNRDRNQEKSRLKLDELFAQVDEIGDRIYTLEDFKKTSEARARRILEIKEPGIKKETIVKTDILYHKLEDAYKIKDKEERLQKLNDVAKEARQLVKSLKETDNGTAILQDAIMLAVRIAETAEKKDRDEKDMSEINSWREKIKQFFLEALGIIFPVLLNAGKKTVVQAISKK